MVCLFLKSRFFCKKKLFWCWSLNWKLSICGNFTRVILIAFNRADFLGQIQKAEKKKKMAKKVIIQSKKGLLTYIGLN